MQGKYLTITIYTHTHARPPPPPPPPHTHIIISTLSRPEWLLHAAMGAILMFYNCEGQSYKTVSTDHNLWRERSAEADSSRGPSAYQPNSLPLDQTGSQNDGIYLSQFIQIRFLRAPTPSSLRFCQCHASKSYNICLSLYLSWCITSRETIWLIRDGGKNGIENECPGPPPCSHSSWALSVYVDAADL